MTTPEGKVKAAVKALLASYRDKGLRMWVHMPVVNGMGAPTLDFICCIAGRFLSIETKAPGQVMTIRQNITSVEMGAAGGIVLVVDGSPNTLGQLNGILTWLLTMQAQEDKQARGGAPDGYVPFA